MIGVNRTFPAFFSQLVFDGLHYDLCAKGGKIRTNLSSSSFFYTFYWRHSALHPHSVLELEVLKLDTAGQRPWRSIGESWHEVSKFRILLGQVFNQRIRFWLLRIPRAPEIRSSDSHFQSLVLILRNGLSNGSASNGSSLHCPGVSKCSGTPKTVVISGQTLIGNFILCFCAYLDHGSKCYIPPHQLVAVVLECKRLFPPAIREPFPLTPDSVIPFHG